MEIQEPTTKHTCTIIMLHGRDCTASVFKQEFFETEAIDASGTERHIHDILSCVRWVFPTAREIPSARFNQNVSQWFDMYKTEDPHERQDEQDIAESTSMIQAIIRDEAAIIGPENVILGGISQGGALSLHALLAQEFKLGGFVGLCTWLPPINNALVSSAALMTPVFLGHAKDDETIDIRYGEELRNALVQLGMDVSWKCYPNGGHWVHEPNGVQDILDFLESKVGVDVAGA